MKWLRRVQLTLQSIKIELYIAAFVVIFSLIGMSAYTYIAYTDALSSKDSIMNSNNTGLILLDRHNNPFYSFYSAKQRTVVPLSQIPVDIQHAVIASEDKDFYHHSGFSVLSTVRSLLWDINKQDTAFGGSTITQQLVKNALLSPKKNFFRKYQEIVLAQELEQKFSKNEILEMYLNSVYLGEGAFGVESAAQYYFGKHAAQLNLSEASLLAAILPAPTEYSPMSGTNPQKAYELQHIVLQKMQEQHYITESQRLQAEQQKITFHPTHNGMNATATHFALMVRDSLVKKYGEEMLSRSGFQVQTTLDLQKQAFAERTVREQVAALAPNRVTNGAAVALDPKTGEIIAYVGSRDWNDSKYGKVNMVETPRSPGSSFKPVVYSAGFEKRLITPGSVLQDVPTTFQPDNYRPLDYDRRFRGNVLVRRALANSLNIPAVEVMQKVGLKDALVMADRLGITTLGNDPSQYGLSLVLGTGEVPLLQMTSAYSVFANNGMRNAPVNVLSIHDKRGRLVYQYNPAPERVLDASVAFLISSILSDNKARAEEFGNALTISRPAAVKTGTAEDYKDALTIGYTPSLVVGVWVGNNDNTPMDQIAGSLGAAPIWKKMMEEYLSGKPIEAFSKPEGVIAADICSFNGGLVSGVSTSSAMEEYFLEGTVPTRRCNYSTNVASVGTGSAVFSAPNITPIAAGEEPLGFVKLEKKMMHGKTVHE